MKVFYDFHIHTALSPCADDDMTPNNIVNMSIIKGLNAIAITDHNASANCKVIMELGYENGLVVIPGMELQTAEDVHLVVLFETIVDLEKFQLEVDTFKIPIKNKPNKFGNQIIYDKEDQVIAYEEQALIIGTNMPINLTFELVSKYNGFVFPAHIDRESNSIISNLGFVPEDLNIRMIELSSKYNEETDIKHININSYCILRNSDAHRLWQISESEYSLEVEEMTAKGILEALKHSECHNKGDK